MPASSKPKSKSQPSSKTELEPITTDLAESSEDEAEVAEAVAMLWYDFARSGQRKSLKIARRAVDLALPLQGGRDSRRRQLVDGAFAIADQAGAAQLALARGALRGTLGTYFDIVVNIDAFNGIAVDVTVPTKVKALNR